MNVARLKAIFAAEFRFQTLRPSFWFLLLLLGFTAFGLSSGSMTIASGDATVGGQSKLWLTSEFSVALMFPLVVFLFYSFFVAVMSGMIVPRDDELRVGPVLHSTRMTPGEYVWGRFAAVMTAFVLVLLAHLIMQGVFNHLWPHEEADKLRGPFQAISYLRPAAFLALPSLVFFCGISFAIGEWTRKPILVFVAPVVAFLVSVFFLFEWSPSWLDPRINRLLMWIEPSGFRWMNETWIKVDRGVDYYNANPVGYDLPFLLSRLAYVVVGLGCVGLAGRRFAGSLRGDSARRTRKKKAAAEPQVVAAPVSAPLDVLGMTQRRPGFLRSALAVAALEARNLALQPGLYLFVPIIVLQVVMNRAFDTGAFDTPILLTPGLAAIQSMNALTLMLCILLMVYTVESVARDRHTNLAPIAWSTPIPTSALLLGKTLANAIVGAVILLAALLGNLIVIAYQNQGVAFDLTPFLLLWGCLLVPTLVVWSGYVTMLLAVAGDRYATYGLALGTLIFTGWKQTKGEVNWVGNWNLWSAATWTDFGGLQPNGMALLMNRLFYAAVLAVAVALAVRVFPRREHDSGRTLDRLRPGAVLRTVWRLAPVLVPALALGTVLYFQVQNGFQGAAAKRHGKDYWGRNVETWRERRTPQIAAADLDVELDPAKRWFRVKGWYDLKNATDEPMTSFPMSVGDHFRNVEWTLDGESVEPEDHAKLYVFEPVEALAPGAMVRVGFSHEGRFPDGFTKNGGGMGRFVLPAGVVLTAFSSDFVPVPFFERDRGTDKDNATEPKQWQPGFYEGVTPPALGSGVRYPVRTRISGPAEYQYHGVGVLQEETVENGVRTVVWQSDFPVNFFNIVAGKWDVWEGKDVAIYHHPDHTYNLDIIGPALEAAREHYSEWFYPYPWKDLRLNEFPGLANYAQGFPTNITFSENIGFLTRVTDESDAPFMVTAHEAAHQWWGNILMPGEGPGGNILSEGMAHFSTMLLFAEEKGEQGRMEFCKRIEASYGDKRQVDAEKPLVWTLGEKGTDTTVMYDKGGWVFWMLHLLMGRQANLEAHHAFIEEYASGPDYPVLQDYVRVMREHAPDPDAFDAFVDQWFFQVVVPEYRLEDVRKVEDGGRWTATATVRNAGASTMAVEVAAVAGERFPEKEDAKPWKEARTTVVLGKGETAEVRIEADFEPEKLVVDPDVHVLMLERDNAEAAL